jgi:acyl CoA:acetate/3-ketoacid CoA transferase alpha subunit
MNLKCPTNLVMKTILLALPTAAVPRLSRGSELGGSCRARVRAATVAFAGSATWKTRGKAGAIEAELVEAAMVAAAFRAGAARTHATYALAATGSECVAATPNVMGRMTGSNLRGVLPEGSNLINSTTR